jgi:hypothetical protein
MLYHVGLSALHTWQELVFHIAIFLPLTALLFHPRATAYLKRPR